MPKIKPPKAKPLKGGVLEPYPPYPNEISVLRDIVKALQYYSALYAAGRMDYKSLRGEQHGLNALRQILATATMIEIKHGAVENQARKPIMVVRERRIERPAPGTPPKRPGAAGQPLIKPRAEPNGGQAAETAPRPPKVSMH